jgi:transposase InsO family protein
VRYAFVACERAHYPLRLLCRVLEVSVSGFHDYRKRVAHPRADPDAAVRAQLHAIHAGSRRTYGRPRLVRALRAHAHPVGAKRVARLMHEEGLRGRCKGGFKPCTTDSRHCQPVATNRLDRRFAVDCSVPAWVGDITYIATREGWLYLAVVISLQTRQVLGYSLSERMPDELVKQAFCNAWSTAPAEPGLLFHSDRGSQYASSNFQRTLTACGIVQSMSRKGNCWDNAVAESFFATLKNEEVNHVYDTKAHAYIAIASYIHGFYNPTRLHSALGYLSPNDYAKLIKQAD